MGDGTRHFQFIAYKFSTQEEDFDDLRMPRLCTYWCVGYSDSNKMLGCLQFSQSVDLNYVESCATHLSGDPNPWVAREHDAACYTRKACLKMDKYFHEGHYSENILKTESNGDGRYLEVQVKHIDKGKCIYVDEAVINTTSQCLKYRILRESRDFITGFDQLEYGFGLKEMEDFTDVAQADMAAATSVLR